MYLQLAPHLVRLGALAALVAALAPTTAAAQEAILWGSLKPGEHAVGYRQLYQLDHARQYDPDYATDTKKPPPHRPRPILICVWYPAQKTKASPFVYRQYLEVSSKDAHVAAFARRLMPHIRDVVCEETIGKKHKLLAPAEKKAFERLLATKTFAVQGAPAAEGKFPGVIYHPGLGGSYDDNSVLFEYLASHGYVVLSSAYPMADANVMNIDWDLPRSFRDMEFLARYAAGLPFADAGRLATMGHSYGAQAALAWSVEPTSSVRAVVSIDSTVENAGIDHPGFARLKAHFQDRKRNLQAPVLRFASRSAKPKFATLEPYLKFAPRYEATVASLDHNDYVTHGAIRPALMPDRWPDANKARALRLSYDRMCRHVLQFLDLSLKQSAEAQAFLQKGLRGEGLDETFTLRFRPPAPAPPTVRQLVLLIRRHGAAKAAERLRSCKEDVESGVVAGAGNTLLTDGQVKEALALLTQAVDIFPKSATVQANLGKARALTGDRKGAIAAYRKAMELVPGEARDEKQSALWKKQLEGYLEELERAPKRPAG